jgi:serine/threonine-protein kinase RsbT
MQAGNSEVLPIQNSTDIVQVRQTVRKWASELAFSLVDQTKIVTAASELARNVLVHGKGGVARVETVQNGSRRGVRLIFEDKGPGIADIEMAMRDGFTTANGLGLGLGGSKRLVNEFDVSSKLGEGTRVTVVKWK